ncbi:3-hydroxyacyl-CoA dehydrogenase family protein [Bacteroidia bacterium]|jgi:3-hydroxybutyryl-CoA dehydrogenase|nr:3-hydroxyacyl-CoA dehydrogenase family protein [Bacteroidia bacterium]
MKIAVIGQPSQLTSFDKLNLSASYELVQDTANLKNYDVFIDLDFDNSDRTILDYTESDSTWVLLNMVKSQLEDEFASVGANYNGEKIIGMNAIPTFLERSTLEYCNPFEVDLGSFPHADLGWETLELVDSRVGMITPRIIFMIINEAYYTVQEGTANKADIDTAMKLGTAYPMGPFEWCERAGLENVYETLEAIYEDTKEERYKICPLMKTEYLQSMI